MTDVQAELSRLCTENAQLKLDKEILKNAVAYFVSESGWGTPRLSTIATCIRSTGAALYSGWRAVGIMPGNTGHRLGRG